MEHRSPSSSLKLVILVAVIAFLALSYIDEFGFSNSKDQNSGLDKRAASVLGGTITHVRDVDTIEVNRISIRIAALDCPEISKSAGRKATLLLTSSKVRKQFAN